ncbi:MAG TPA: hypothetical protein VLB83_00125 [Candidatus Paceibacterota bacterium]|nr:hypothetical protein [Candidatus Paceibacterota bacterium]
MARTLASYYDPDDQLPMCELPEELRLIEVEIGRDIVESTHRGHPASRQQMNQDEWDDASLVENADRFNFS